MIPRTRLCVALITLAAGAAIAWAQDSKPAGGAPNPQTPPATPAVTPTGEQPKLTMSMSEWDFGQKWFGEPAEAEVTLKNEGTAPLTIVNIRSSCGCTVAKPKNGGVWQNKVLQPGESDIMSLTYNTRKPTAKVTQTITIESNDPRSPNLAFQVKGEIKQLFAYKPSDRVTFPRIERDEKAEQTIELTSNLTDQQVKLELIPLESVRFDVKLETVEDGKSYKITAATKPPLELGANSAVIRLKTNVAQAPEITIPISAFIQPRVSVSPPRIMVSPKITQSFEKRIRVNFKPDKPLNVTSVKSTTDKIKCEILPPSPAPNPSILAFREIKVTLPPGNELPAEGAKIEIETDDPAPEYKKFTVEVVVRDTTVRPATQPVAPGAPGAAPGKPTPTPTPGATPGAAKPGDAKPGEAKPGDAKPGDVKPGDAKPGDAKPGDAKP